MAGTTDTVRGARFDGHVEDGLEFTGVREEARAILEATAEWLEGRLTKEQHEAAHLMAEFLDPTQVDAALDLPSGTTREWAKLPPFVEEAAQWRAFLKQQRDVDVDFGRALDARQRQAARLLVLDHRTQKEAAEEVGVDPRSVRNWLRRPAFQRYMEQIEQEAETQERRRREARLWAVEDRLTEVQGKAIDRVEKLLEEDDPAVAIAVLRLRKR